MMDIIKARPALESTGITRALKKGNMNRMTLILIMMKKNV